MSMPPFKSCLSVTKHGRCVDVALILKKHQVAFDEDLERMAQIGSYDEDGVSESEEEEGEGDEEGYGSEEA